MIFVRGRIVFRCSDDQSESTSCSFNDVQFSAGWRFQLSIRGRALSADSRLVNKALVHRADTAPEPLARRTRPVLAPEDRT